MKNKIAELISRLEVTPYRFARSTKISTNTIYALKNDPTRFPSQEVFDKIITVYGVTVGDIVEAD